MFKNSVKFSSFLHLRKEYWAKNLVKSSINNCQKLCFHFTLKAAILMAGLTFQPLGALIPIQGPTNSS